MDRIRKNATYCIQNAETGLILDIADGTSVDGEVILYQSNGGDNQQFIYKQDKLIYLKVRPDLALTISKGKVQLKEVKGDESQRWTFERDGTLSNETGYVLDVGRTVEPNTFIKLSKKKPPYNSTISQSLDIGKQPTVIIVFSFS